MGDLNEQQATRKRIVVGVDGSRASRGALRWALREAQLCAGGAPRLEPVGAPRLPPVERGSDAVRATTGGHTPTIEEQQAEACAPAHPAQRSRR